MSLGGVGGDSILNKKNRECLTDKVTYVGGEGAGHVGQRSEGRASMQRSCGRNAPGVFKVILRAAWLEQCEQRGE